jgi:hypothetical protein
MAKRNRFVNLTGSGGVVIAGEGILDSMYVNNTSSGTLRLFSSPTQAANEGGVMAGLITPAIGFHYLGNLHSTIGVYALMDGVSLDITFHVRETD